MTESMAAASCFGLSSQGRERDSNQDSVLSCPQLGLWAVADGMGGHSLGGLASRRISAELSALAFAADQTLTQRLTQVSAVLATLSEELQETARQQPKTMTIGSTVIVLLIRQHSAGFLWSGDSRLYHFSAGQFRRLSCDHTVANALMREGLSAEQAARDPEAQHLTQAVGVPTFSAELGLVPCAPGDWFLLCSDGLTRCVDEPALAQVLATATTAQAAAYALLNLGLENGAPDDISLIVVGI